MVRVDIRIATLVLVIGLIVENTVVAENNNGGYHYNLRRNPSLFFQRELEDEDAEFSISDFQLRFGSMSMDYDAPTPSPTATTTSGPTTRPIISPTTMVPTIMGSNASPNASSTTLGPTSSSPTASPTTVMPTTSVSTASPTANPTTASCQNILWSDNFEQPHNTVDDTVDAAIWSYDLGNGPDGWGNKELQDYTKENVKVQDGNLIITVQKNQNDAFTSGRIRTQDKLEILYGTIEARIKIPPLANGLWPAFWTLGGNFREAGWPASGEMDIMEMGFAQAIADGVVPQQVISAAHWKGGQATNLAAFTSTEIDFTDGEYHLFRLEWTSSSIVTYADDNLILEMDIGACADTDCSEFHQPHFLLFNVAVGGTFTGILNATQVSAPFPAEMKVDYVRVCDNGETVLSGSSIEPPLEYTFDCGLPDICTASALNNYAGDAKCGDRIQILMDTNGMSEEAACEQVASIEYPEQCGVCREQELIDCGVPDTCTREVLETDADGFPCGDRINYLINVLGQSESDACNQIAAVEFPGQCGPCTPPSVPTIDCGLPDTCTPEVLGTDAGGFPCGDRMSFLINSMGQSEPDACNQVAAVEFPSECGGCAPVGL